MAEKDISEKMLEAYNDVFADIVFEEYTYNNSSDGDVTMSDVLTKLINEDEARGFIEAAFKYGASIENVINEIISKFSLSEEAFGCLFAC